MERVRRLRWVFALIGFTAVIAQIVFMRELIVVFYGNELSLGLMLAVWLLWTAAGSALLGRISLPSRPLTAILQACTAILLPLTVLAVRSSRTVFTEVPGEVLGPGPTLLTALVALGAFCLCSGWSFSAAVRLLASETGVAAAEAAGTVYLFEAIGAGAGGALAGLLLVQNLGAFEIVLSLAALNLLAAVALWRRSLATGAATYVFAAAAIPWIAPPLESLSLARLWTGFSVIETRTSPYGNLTITGTAGTRSLFENGLISFTAPAPEAAEEAVHYALLQHAAPRNVLLIGGSADGSLPEVLRHRTIERIDAVEIDPAVFDLARRYFPASVPADSRVHVHYIDGRLFLRRAPVDYDVIVVHLPDPRTAQLNRFYTLEFFQEAAARLRADGVFSFQVSGAENYLSPRLTDMLRSLRKTLEAVFPDVTAIPGETTHFFAAKRAGTLLRDPGQIAARLGGRNLGTSYVREYFVPYRMMPDRMREFDSLTRPLLSTPVNRDFAPIAYYYHTMLWSSRFDSSAAPSAGFGFAPMMAITGAVMLAVALAVRRRAAAAAGFGVAAMGFTLMGLEVLLLLAFQAVHGYVYQQLATITGALMAGVAVGAWRARSSLPRLAALQTAAMLAPLALCLMFRAPAPQITFPAAAFLAGFLGGYQFRAAVLQAPGCRPGTFYALDLTGACLGAITLSVYLVPAFGLYKTAFVMAMINAAPAILLASCLRKRAR